MAKVAILPVSSEQGEVSYHAVAGDKQSRGRTAGEALDALTTLLPKDETSTLVIVQNLRPDEYFSLSEQQRLAELMQRWRQALEVGQTLSDVEQNELNGLIEAELRGSAARAAALADEIGR